MNRLPISVCFISGAESVRIGRALASVAEWAAEIIVVLNQEVHDGTEEIARKHGAIVHRHPWRGFREQKNLVSSYASQPWILQLDADEEVSAELRDELFRFFDGEQERFAGASFPRSGVTRADHPRRLVGSPCARREPHRQTMGRRSRRTIER